MNIETGITSLFGFKSEEPETELTEKEIYQILNINNINIDENKNLSVFLTELELKEWTNVLSPVQIVKSYEKPNIKIKVPAESINKTYEWIVEKEDGSSDSGKFLASHLRKTKIKHFAKDGTFFELEVNLPLNLELGYHNLKIKYNSKEIGSSRLIVVPKECYKPLNFDGQGKLNGPKVYFYNISTEQNHRVADAKDLKSLIKKLTPYEVDLIGTGPINQTSLDENNNFNPFLPSSRMFLNTLFLNTDEMVKFIGDEKLQLKFHSLEFQEDDDELNKAEATDYKVIFDLKFKKFKLLYQSFCELHINKKTTKAKEFLKYIVSNGKELHYLALYRALQDFLKTEVPKYINWNDWPKAYQNPESEVVKKFESNNNELIEFYKFLQWQADIQLGEAGKTSYENKLKVGIYVDMSLCVDPSGAETWAYSDYFSHTPNMLSLSDTDEQRTTCPLILPSKIYESAYSYIKNILSANMVHAGAINLLDIECILNPKCETTIDGQKKSFILDYSINDVLSVIALESQKNKCLVAVNMTNLPEEYQTILKQYGIVNENIFDIETIKNEEELKDYYNRLKAKKGTITYIDEESHITKIPNSTYRIQFNKDFTFNDGKEIIPYLKKLGISHVYSSPLLSPRKGSMHAYDTINHNKINQEAGTQDEFNAFLDTLHHYGIGLILDMVPNHMGIGQENKWWMDVLENGQSSEFSHYFDIDWNPIKPELKGKVLIPVLGDHYGNVVSSGQLEFKFNENEGKLSANYYEHKFPLNPSSYPLILEHRIEVLKTRLGRLNKDLLEYQSIITVFKNLPEHTITEYEKTKERTREKNIASERLSKLCQNNYLIKGFIEENLIDFKCSEDDPIAIERVHGLLEEQPYRLAFWRVSVDEINYRRFFDINDLAALCVEKPDVFADTHNFIFNLIENKKIDGLRLDHPDGLLEPVNYYQKLQTEIAKKLDLDFDQSEENLLCSEKLPFYIVAEKILAPFEKLSPHWAIHGTVGYEFLNSVSGIFINSENEQKFTHIYQKFIEQEINFEELVIECKKLIMNTSLTGELNVLSNNLNKISEQYIIYRDYTLNSIKSALVEVISCFPVYRTYITKEREITKGKDYIKWAIGLAKKRSVITDTSIFDFIEKILLLELETDTNSTRCQDILKFTLKFQQYTGPLMAKGYEDTCFYRYNRLIALNEVGGEPNKFGTSTDEFHQSNINRMESTPNGMINTSTHDTKRSEDVRARICAISEIPEEWQKSIRRWNSLNRNKKSRSFRSIEIDKNDEYLIYQTLVGIWPTEIPDDNAKESLTKRVEDYILKAAREAKVHTSWVNINTEYEQTICNFIRTLLNYPEKHPFWNYFKPLQEKIANVGYINSVSQCLLKLTAPGVPDIYQGNEIFKFSLVDPDNRRPVDYDKLNSELQTIQGILNNSNEENRINLLEEILLPFDSGRLKLFYTSSTLHLRQKNPDLFKYGHYIPLQVSGENSKHILAFARQYDKKATITVVPRLIYHFISEKEPFKLNKELFANTKLIVPDELREFNWIDTYTKKSKTLTNDELSVSDLLEILPATLLEGNKSS